MKRILLTGFGGFIGNNIYQRVSLKNSSIFIMSCIEKGYINKRYWKEGLDSMVQQSDIILHVGAISDTMLQDNNEMLKYNYEFSRVLFDLSEEHNKQVIYSSSGANTGESGLPSNSYGWSKYITEQYGMSKVTKKGTFKLFPGEPKRDFVYIDDVVDATLYPVFNEVPKGVYEVGSGESRTFEDVLDLMKIKYTYREQNWIPKGYQFFTRADKNKFMEGWSPKYNLEKGIKKYKDYLNENL